MDPWALGAIVTVCGIGLAFTSYNIGIKEGAEKMLDKLEEIRIVNVDKEGRVSANCDKHKI